MARPKRREGGPVLRDSSPGVLTRLRGAVLGYVASERANSAQQEGDYAEAINQYRLTYKLFRQAFGERGQLTVQALSQLAWNLGHSGDHGEAELQYRRLIRSQGNKPRDSNRAAGLHVRLAHELYEQKKFAKAEAEYQQALEIMQSASDVELAIQGVAASRLAQGRPDDAEPYFLRQLVTEGYTKRGQADILTLTVQYGALKDRRKWSSLARMQVQLLEATRDPVDPDLALALINLAEVHRIEGDTDESKSLLLRSRRMVRALNHSHDQLLPAISKALKRLRD